MLIGIYALSEAIYDNPPPARPSYNISGRELPPLETKIEPDKKQESGRQEPYLAKAMEGIGLFRQCAACHTVNGQGANRVGPSLWNIVDRPVASLDNYRYSQALQALGESGAIWDEERLDAYITAPAKTVVGTTMAFRGLSDAQARAAIIAYLRSLIPEGERKNDAE